LTLIRISHAYPTAAAVLLLDLAHALLGHLALRFLLQLWVEFLHQPVEALYLLVLGLAALNSALQPERGQLGGQVLPA
jgi:hypothetical protein